MATDQFYKIGHISRVHGNDGKVYIKLDVDNPADYSELESVFFEMENKPVPFFVEYSRQTPNGPLLKFDDINDREEAEGYVGTSLLLPIEVLPKLSDGKFYFHELIGALLIDKSKGALGEIKLIYDQTSQILLGVEKNGTEYLVPLVEAFNPFFKRNDNQLEMDLPDGIVEINESGENEN